MAKQNPSPSRRYQVLRMFNHKGTVYGPVDRPFFTEEEVSAIEAKNGDKPFLKAFPAQTAKAPAVTGQA